MRRTFLIIAFLISGIAGLAHADEFTSKIICEVQHRHVTKIVDGKTKVSSTRDYSFIAGDPL